MLPAFIKPLIAAAFCLSVVSCADQYARQVTYQLGNSYQEARMKLGSYHQEQVRGFNLFHDKVMVSVDETIPEQESRFSKTFWAPDIGTVPSYESVLKRKGAKCEYVITELASPRVAYDTPRAITGDELGPLKSLDAWVSENLVVTSRQVGVDSNSGPIHKTGL